MGIDYGDRRVGIALSDPMRWSAHEYETINVESKKMLFNRIKEIIDNNNVDKIIVGMPKNMDGTIGKRGEITQGFIKELERRHSIMIIPWDERLSTVSATKILNETNVRGEKRKKRVDSMAASFILQSYLNSLQP
jgi:putative Holliday junction resolvase